MIMLTIAKRNIMLYFRDRIAVFFSFLAVIILIALYVFFLGDMTSAGLPDFPEKKPLLTLWFIAGILAVASVTTTLGAFGILVEDRTNKVDMDFKSSPIPPSSLVAGYIASAMFIGISMCLTILAFAQLYLLLSGSTVIPFLGTVQLTGLIILAVAANGSMILFLVSFLRTSNAFASVSMVIGTFIGFLAGIYIPIGGLPDYLHSAVKWFPVSHTVALFRQVLTEIPLLDAFATAPPEMKETFSAEMGITYNVNGKPLSKMFSVFYLIGTTVIFSFLSFFFMKKKR